MKKATQLNACRASQKDDFLHQSTFQIISFTSYPNLFSIQKKSEYILWGNPVSAFYLLFVQQWQMFLTENNNNIKNRMGKERTMKSRGIFNRKSRDFSSLFFYPFHIIIQSMFVRPFCPKNILIFCHTCSMALHH